MPEKKAIELATIKAFLSLYNLIMGTNYKVKSHSENPDFVCCDSDSNIFQADVTLTESYKGDIKARLGRSKHKDPNNFSVAHKSLYESTIDSVLVSIRKKLVKRYGSNTALVVRDTCPLDLNWDLLLDQIKEELNNECNPYDKGIWIIANSKDKIYRVI